MIAKKRRKLLALCLSMAMLFSVISLQVTPMLPVKAAGYGISNPRTDKNGVSTWDCIYFGNYYQSNSTTKEPIKWRVLSVNGDDAFLLADKNLDCQPYNTKYTKVTWETCTLRNWLNNDFCNAAFSDEEKNAIKTTLVVNWDNPEDGTEGGNSTNDKVYLLSIQEAMNPSYGFSSDYDDSETREAKNTEYAKEQGALTDESDKYSGNGWWWLRSPGYYSSNAAGVNSDGCVHGYGGNVCNYNIAVRPALHLNLSSNKWSKAGTVNSVGVSTIETEEPTISSKPAETNKPTVLPKPTNKPVKIKAPARVKKLTAKNKKKKAVSLSWKKISGVKGYQIQYALNKKFKKKKKTNIKKNRNKLTIKKLKKKKTYYFRVCAYKLNGKKKVYGKWSKAKKVKIRK